jgi:signal transduction histidine kinase
VVNTESERVVVPQQPFAALNLDDLMGHLSSTNGLYSKETFVGLYACITRMLRDYGPEGFVLTRTLNDPAFGALAYTVSGRDRCPVFCLDGYESSLIEAGLKPETGFLLVLTNRLCAAVYWSVAPDDSYRLYPGGWTFHPADTKTIACQMVGRLGHSELMALLESTQIDRRYDDKLNLLVAGLVQGLEARNRELTVALNKVNTLNQQMVQQERLAAIGQLCSVIAHEIRNPLGLIDLYAKLVESQTQQVLEPLNKHPELKQMAGITPQSTDQLFQNLSMIRQATTHLDAILTELTQYSRPLELNLELTELNSFVQSVCEFVKPSFDANHVALQLQPLADGPLELPIDTGRIRQALHNILKNALEVSPQGSRVVVKLTTRQGDDQVYIKICDQGGGVSERAQEKLFTPYFSTKGAKGTGLGLAHCRKILQAHGGNVLMLETSLQGSTFALVLPKSAKIMAAAAQHTEPATTSVTQPTMSASTR